MHSAYHIILFIVAIVGLFVGFRKGLISQLAGVLGVILGILAVHLFSDSVEPTVRQYFTSLQGSFFEDYAYNVLTAGLIFIAVYALLQLTSFLFKSILGMMNLGILNSLLGSLFCLFKFMLIMSVVFNIILSIDNESSLSEYCDADDGNIVGVVMGMAPTLFSTESPDDLLYIKQKEEAKSISQNNFVNNDVYRYSNNNKNRAKII